MPCILVTNDDGVSSEGIRVLADAVGDCLRDSQDDTLAFARMSLPIDLDNPMYRHLIAAGVVAPVEWRGDEVLTEGDGL